MVLALAYTVKIIVYEVYADMHTEAVLVYLIKVAHTK